MVELSPRHLIRSHDVYNPLWIYINFISIWVECRCIRTSAVSLTTLHEESTSHTTKSVKWRVRIVYLATCDIYIVPSTHTISWKHKNKYDTNEECHSESRKLLLTY